MYIGCSKYNKERGVCSSGLLIFDKNREVLSKCPIQNDCASYDAEIGFNRFCQIENSYIHNAVPIREIQAKQSPDARDLNERIKHLEEYTIRDIERNLRCLSNNGIKQSIGIRDLNEKIDDIEHNLCCLDIKQSSDAKDLNDRIKHLEDSERIWKTIAVLCVGMTALVITLIALSGV